MGDRQSVEALQWLAYIGRTRNNVTHADNGREVRLTGVPHVKVDGYCEETNEVFEYLGCFWHGCICISNRRKPIGKTEETLENRYEETKAKLQKIVNAGYKVVSIWGCEFRKMLSENRCLENEICSDPYVKNSPINIRDASYGIERKLLKHITESRKGRRSTM
jgi:G:T-mismatch repair DNA endonuclease (very short patch repair protein)